MLRAVVMSALVLGTIAIAVDMGMIVLVRTRLQTEADASAVSTAVALADPASPKALASDGHRAAVVELGYWDANTRTFTPTRKSHNAVRVTAEGWGPFFFARWIGREAFVTRASAVAMTRADLPADDYRLSPFSDPRIVQ